MAARHQSAVIRSSRSRAVESTWRERDVPLDKRLRAVHDENLSTSKSSKCRHALHIRTLGVVVTHRPMNDHISDSAMTSGAAATVFLHADRALPDQEGSRNIVPPWVLFDHRDRLARQAERYCRSVIVGALLRTISFAL